MNNRTAIAASSGMVLVAALGAGALIVAGGEPAPSVSVGATATQPEVVVEYVDAAGARIPLEASIAAMPASAPTSAYEDHDHEYEDGHYEDDEYEEHDDYEDEEHEDGDDD